MTKRYIDHSEPVKVPKFDNLATANKAVDAMFWELHLLDALLCDIQHNKEWCSAIPYLHGVVCTQRGKIAKCLRSIEEK